MESEFIKHVNEIEKKERQRHARLNLLDDALFKLYQEDPIIHAAVYSYVIGKITLEQALIQAYSIKKKQFDDFFEKVLTADRLRVSPTLPHKPS